MQTRSWDDKETGQKKYRTEILVNDLSLLSGRDEGSGGGGYSRGGEFRLRLDRQLRPAPDRRLRRSCALRRNLRR